MFKNKKGLFAALATALLAALTILGCVKTEFDEPPVDGVIVELTPNRTIAQLKALHLSSGSFDRITEDIIICGEVTMDDRSGNYYKTLVIEDETGGIEVKFNDGFLYTQFPVGRKICIRCKDLILTDYNGVTQLTGSLVDQGGVFDAFGLTESQVRVSVAKGAYADRPKSPKSIDLSMLSKDLISTLVRLDSVQFIVADTAKTFADAVTLNSLNRTLEDCGGRKLVIRTSGYANFAGQKTPAKKGSVTGVLGIFGTTYQLYLRDINDVNMQSTRCSAGGVGNEVLKDIATIRSGFTGSTTTAPDNSKIKGIVISDRAGKNLNGQNLYIQDATGGIVVRFEATHSFDLGDEIEVVVSKEELSEFNKLLQVNSVPLARARVIRKGQTVTPREATIADIIANFEKWESTLVRIKNATITGGATLSGSRNVADGTGTIVMFTQTAATVAATATPANAVTLTAIVSEFSTTSSPNGKQIILRNASDIQN